MKKSNFLTLSFITLIGILFVACKSSNSDPLFDTELKYSHYYSTYKKERDDKKAWCLKQAGVADKNEALASNKKLKEVLDETNYNNCYYALGYNERRAYRIPKL